MGRVWVTAGIVLLLVLSGCNSGKDMREQDITTYKRAIYDRTVWLPISYDRFMDTLRTHKRSEIALVHGTAPGSKDGYDEVLTDDEYIQVLTAEAKDYAEQYELFTIAADEYYAYLTANEKELRKDGYNVALEKIDILEDKARYRDNGEAMAAALNNLIAQQEAIQEAQAELTKQVISLLLAAI